MELRQIDCLELQLTYAIQIDDACLIGIGIIGESAIS